MLLVKEFTSFTSPISFKFYLCDVEGPAPSVSSLLAVSLLINFAAGVKTTAALVSTLSVSLSALTVISVPVHWLLTSLSNSWFLPQVDAVNVLAAGVVIVEIAALLEIWSSIALWN